MASEGLALITNASSAVGMAFAKLHASRGGDLILVSPHADMLDAARRELENAHNIQVTCAGLDLGEYGAPERLFESVISEGAPVSYLINNALSAAGGPFHEQDIERIEEALNLNVASMVKLTRLFLPFMIEAGRGRVLNVAPAGGGGRQSLLAASRAFVLSFSEALAAELDGAGVSVTAMIPGAADGVSEAELAAVNAAKGVRADKIAEAGYRAMLRGKATAKSGGGMFGLGRR